MVRGCHRDPSEHLAKLGQSAEAHASERLELERYRCGMTYDQLVKRAHSGEGMAWGNQKIDSSARAVPHPVIES